MRKLLFLLLLAVTPAVAQSYNVNIGGISFTAGASVPGSCPQDGAFLFKNTTTKGWYSCVAGTWAAFGTGAGSVTSVATTSPITGGTITGTGTIACATCVTSAAALTSTAIITGAGSQASQTPSATATLNSSGNMSLPGTLAVTGHLTLEGVTSTGATGTGLLVFGTSPTLTTPILGVATVTSVNKVAFTAPASSATVAIADGKTLTVSNSLTFAGTDSTTMTFPSTSATVTQTIASGTSALGTSAISSAACATVVTTSATGTATTDVITAGFNGDPTGVTGYVASTSGMLTIIAYPSTNNVNFKVCNNTSASITPGAITLNWRVVR